MKRPKHMNMKELIALPVLQDRERLHTDHGVSNIGYGGAFRDDHGHVWGTLRLNSGWVRYPSHLSL